MKVSISLSGATWIEDLFSFFSKAQHLLDCKIRLDFRFGFDVSISVKHLFKIYLKSQGKYCYAFWTTIRIALLVRSKKHIHEVMDETGC